MKITVTGDTTSSMLIELEHQGVTLKGRLNNQTFKRQWLLIPGPEADHLPDVIKIGNYMTHWPAALAKATDILRAAVIKMRSDVHRAEIAAQRAT